MSGIHSRHFTTRLVSYLFFRGQIKLYFVTFVLSILVDVSQFKRGPGKKMKTNHDPLLLWILCPNGVSETATPTHEGWIDNALLNERGKTRGRNEISEEDVVWKIRA